MCCGVQKARMILRAALILVLVSAPASLAAQTFSENDPDVTITTIEGPKNAAFAIGNGTVWFLAKDRLFKLDAQNNLLPPVPMEQLKRVGYAAGGWAVGGGSVWRFGKAHDVEGVHRFDPGTGKCVATVSLKPRKGSNSLTYGLGSLWVLNEHDGILVRIDPATNQVSAMIELGKGFWQDLKIADGAVWAMGVENGKVERVDPQSNKVVDEFSVGPPQKNGLFTMVLEGGSYYSSVADGMLLVADSKDISSGKYTLFRIDPRTHERVAKIEIDNANGVPVFWNGYVWLATTLNTVHVITKIDPKVNRVARQISLPGRRDAVAPSSLLADENSLWDFTLGYGSAPIIVRRIQAKAAELRQKD